MSEEKDALLPNRGLAPPCGIAPKIGPIRRPRGCHSHFTADCEKFPTFLLFTELLFMIKNKHKLGG